MSANDLSTAWHGDTAYLYAWTRRGRDFARSFLRIPVIWGGGQAIGQDDAIDLLVAAQEEGLSV